MMMFAKIKQKSKFKKEQNNKVDEQIRGTYLINFLGPNFRTVKLKRKRVQKNGLKTLVQKKNVLIY